MKNTMKSARRLSREDKIIAAPKSLEVTMNEVKAEMDANSGDFEKRLNVPGLRGILRVIIHCRHESETCWSISVIPNSETFNGRIDCIDWEQHFIDMEGVPRSGFHRHVWNARAKSCERFKVVLSGFHPSGAEDFISSGLKLIGIVPKKEDISHVRALLPIR